MRPALKLGLLPVWRDRDTLQIGIDPRRAIALSGMSRAAIVIGLLDGSRDRDQVIAAAAQQGIATAVTERVLTLLAAGGALDDFPVGTLREVPATLRARFAAELATASLAHQDSDGGARTLARRRGYAVAIDGDRRICRGIARILAAAGVGQIRLGELRPPEGAAGMVGAASEAPQNSARGPDLVILAGTVPRDLAEHLVGDKTPHLAAAAGEAIGVVGPLVLPGRTACLRCMDYVRAASDPAWPLILAQISSRRPEPLACDAVLVAMVAAQAAGQALTVIDRTPMASAAANGTLEVVLPDWRWRRRTWSPHPACLCQSHRTVTDTRGS